MTPVEVSAEILRVLRRRGEDALGGPLGGPVITVPAYFDDAQRQATRDAGRLAGLEVLRLLNEPTAAALAYGLDRRSEGVFAVYDLGGGTFEHAEDDLGERMLREERVAAEQILRQAEQALAADAALTDPGEREAIEAAMAALKSAAAGGNHAAIREKREALDRVSAPFAERRMDAAVQRALAGKRVDSVP